MTVIRTKTNMVVAYEPEPTDRFVQVVWHGPGQDGSPYARTFEGAVEPIAEYDATVAWAQSLADQMCSPLYVVPISDEEAADARAAHCLRKADLGLPMWLPAGLRRELRQLALGIAAEAMRASSDPDVRATADFILKKLKVN